MTFREIDLGNLRTSLRADHNTLNANFEFDKRIVVRKEFNARISPTNIARVLLLKPADPNIGLCSVVSG